jgi:hypothetical protein
LLRLNMPRRKHPRPRATHVRKNRRRRRLVAALLCAGRAKSVESRTSGTGDRW